MNAIKQFWQDFKSEPDIWFFYALLLTFPFSIRKVITFYPIQGRFNEYSGIYLYLSDVFSILTLFSWIFILCHKYSILSIYTTAPLNRLKLWIKSFPQVTPKHFLAYLGLILVLWSFLSLGWSESKSLSLFRSIKLLEFYLLAIFVAYRIVPSAYAKASADKLLPETKMFHPESNVPRGTFDGTSVEHLKGGGTILRDTLKLVIFGGIVNSVLAIWQFAIQHSVGLTFLKESVIGPDMPGVSKIVILGHKLIRAYGFFPHPNVLGGFLLFSIVLTIYYRKMFHVEHSNQDCHSGLDPESSLKSRSLFSGSQIPACRTGRKSGMTYILIAIQILALILTFSKSAIIGLFITLAYIYVSRGGTFKLAKTALFTFFAISVFISVFPGLSPIQNQSLEEREMLINVSRLPVRSLFHPESNVPRGTFDGTNVEQTKEGETIRDIKGLIFGLGQSQLVWSMRNLDLADWQYQPVHNVFLLIWSELGIVGLILFVLILYKMLHACPAQCSTPAPPKNVPRGTFEGGWNIRRRVEHSQGGETLRIFQGILLAFIFIILFDHYLWDIQQGQIMLWMALGFIAGMSLTENNISDNISL